MGDLLCRLTYFQYTDAISERNMDRRLQVCNDEISGNGSFVVGDEIVGSGQWRALLANINYKY
jgi:hypothetical protein